MCVWCVCVCVVCGTIVSNLSTVKHFKAKFGCPQVRLYEGRVLQTFLEDVKMQSITSAFQSCPYNGSALIPCLATDLATLLQVPLH